MNLDELRTTTRAVITVTETAALLEVDERTVHRGIDDGGIPAVRVGRRVLIPVQRLLPLLIDPQTDSEPEASTPGNATTRPATQEQAHDPEYDLTQPELRSISA